MKHYHGLQVLEGLPQHCIAGHQAHRDDRFGRMFPHLPPAYTLPQILEEIGSGDDNGPMNNGDTSDRTQTVSVGMVIFGQFIDHDITLDTSSSFASVNHPTEINNVRTPTLDLDSIYGTGPEAQPYLYSQTPPFNNAKLLTGADVNGADDKQKNDLLRSPNGRAIIGDPRNDENRIISQMQLGLINFHNKLCDEIYAESKADGHPIEGEELYEEVRQKVTWHYQWAVVNDFLVSMCGKAVVDDVLGSGRKYYLCDVPYMPIEFAVAAYRFGHSMVPMKIQVQKGDNPFEFFGQILGRGFSPVGDVRAIVDWHEQFFTPANRQVQRAEKLDTKMAGDLLKLPFLPDSVERSLATRNLLRGNSFRLPGGDAVARHMERPDTEIEAVMNRVSAMSDGKITNGAPLWLYILAEAEVIGRETSPGTFESGEGLGPIGARIVAEVLIGLLEFDSHSYLGANRNWKPSEEYDSIGKMLASVNSDLV